MAKKNKGTEFNGIWANVKEEDFYNDKNIKEVDMSEYNNEMMEKFMLNANLSRQITRLFSGLTPVRKRGLYMTYRAGLTWNKNAAKSAVAVAETNKIHPHGDGPIYKALINAVQLWKICQPLYHIDGSVSNESAPDEYAAQRYTESKLSKYATECFFENYMKECIEFVPDTINNTGIEEPMDLPAKFPNGLINGSYGFTIGSNTCIPSYNITDLYDACVALIKDPEAEIFMIPEVVTGCDIIDNGTFKDIIEQGVGKLRMRGRIDITETTERGKEYWVLHIRSFPWITDLSKIISKDIAKLIKENKIPVSDVRDHTYPFKDKNGVLRHDIDIQLWVPKEHDPLRVRNIIYNNTQLDYTLGIDIQVVTEDLKLRHLSVREYILEWLDEAREYKRRLVNRKLSKNFAEMEAIDILIKIIKDQKCVQDFISIVHKSDTEDEYIEKMGKRFGITSYQAMTVYNISVNRLKKLNDIGYKTRMEELEKENKKLMKLAKSPKAIDEQIVEDLGDMLKYATEKKCRVISLDKNIEVSNTDHIIIITKDGFIKKLPITNKKKRTSLYGTFNQGDYPVQRIDINNLEQLVLMDSTGKYSIIPVSDIPATGFNEVGYKVYDVAKLDGKIVHAMKYLEDKMQKKIKKAIGKENFVGMDILSISKDGFAKRTPLKDIQGSRNVCKGRRYSKVKDGDEIVFATLVFNRVDIMIYTKKGEFSYIPIDMIAEMSANSQGLSYFSLNEKDEVVGCTSLSDKEDQIVILTEKGNMKRIHVDGLGDLKKRKQSSYLSRLSEKDNIFMCEAICTDKVETLQICTKNTVHEININDIPLLGRMHLPEKVIPMPVGDYLIKITKTMVK